MFVASRGIGQYIRQHFLDTTFRGLYHANAFDMALLVPYFIVLILLASYGLHRYVLVYLYYKHRKNRTIEPAGYFPDLPRVTVQLPIFNEQFVIERLLDAVCRLQYPLDRLDVQVLDDSTDETQAVARGLVEQYAARGFPVTYHHRNNREGFKAGALAEGMKTAKGEFIAIFDADFVPPEDFLMRTIHHLTDPKIGMVQTRWTHINRNYSFLTEVEAILLDGHFVLEHSGRARSNVFFNFNGTAGIWRRSAIEELADRALLDAGETPRRLHRNASSSSVAASVCSSRYLTITGAYSDRPSDCASAPLAARAPGTTTAPAGISSTPPCGRRYT